MIPRYTRPAMAEIFEADNRFKIWLEMFLCSAHHFRLLQGMLQQVYIGMADPSGDVRNAAMFALGQFSEHLQVSYI